jgi:hypothetical protein
MFIKFGLLCLTVLTISVNSQILVSKSTKKTDPVLLKYTPCLSRDNFIFYNNTDPTIEKVTWYTTRGSATERLNKKTSKYWPFDFKGGSNMNARPWNTLNVPDDTYFLYTNIYRNGTISEKSKLPFVVCNTVSLFFSDNKHMIEPRLIQSDSLIINKKKNLYIGVLPSDDIEDITVTYDDIILNNLITNIINVVAFVDNTDGLDLSTNVTHTIVANFTTIFGSTGIRRVILDTPFTESPTEKSTENPITEKPTEVKTESPTKKHTEKPTEIETELPTEVKTESPTKKHTEKPTEVETESPTKKHTEKPTEVETESPTKKHTEKPTEVETEKPTTEVDTESPTIAPTIAPSGEPSKLVKQLKKLFI